MDLTTIGKNIKKYRTEKGMKQEMLAEKANLTPNYIGMLERSDKLPSLTTLINIIDYSIAVIIKFCESLKSGFGF